MRLPSGATLLAAALASTLLNLGPAGASADTSDDRVPDQVVVLFRDGIPANIDDQLLPSETILNRDDVLRYVTLQVFPDLVEDTIDRYAGWPQVDVAYQARYAHLAAVPNDLSYGNQWGPPVIGMHEAWDHGFGSHNVTVAVLDTGVDYLHEDLAPNTAIGDRACGPDLNLVGAPSSMVALDDHGHGTHVAGTVAAVTNNHLGVAGMAQACLMTVKVLSGSGSGTWQQVASGVTHAATNGADIISMSLGGSSADPVMAAAVTDAWNQGVLIVAAAGNSYCPGEGANTVLYPAAFPEVVAVASLQAPGDVTAASSSCGPRVEIAAPGAGIYSTFLHKAASSSVQDVVTCVQSLIFGGECVLPNPQPGGPGNLDISVGYGYMSGTSMATPHVSGVAALMKEANPALTNGQLRCLLHATADDLGPVGWDPGFGHGRLDAAGAVLGAADPAAAGC